METAYNDIGSNYINKSDYLDSHTNFTKAHILFEQIGDKTYGLGIW